MKFLDHLLGGEGGGGFFSNDSLAKRIRPVNGKVFVNHIRSANKSLKNNPPSPHFCIRN